MDVLTQLRKFVCNVEKIALCEVQVNYKYVITVNLSHRYYIIRPCVKTIRPSCHRVRTLRHSGL